MDEELEASMGLPKDEFDVPISITSHQFNEDGSFWSPDANNERLAVFGDVIFANGQPWPKMTVEPRKYRFRLLNAALSRSFFLYMEEDGSISSKGHPHYKSVRPGRSSGAGFTNTTASGVPAPEDEEPKPRVPFIVVASDSGFLSEPVLTDDLYLSMAERYEIIIDFSAHAGKKVTLKNFKGFSNDCDFLHTDKVMQFHVKEGTFPDDSTVPNSLVEIDYPRPGEMEREFSFNGIPGVGWTINGVRFDDVSNRVLARPERGVSERWILRNLSPGFSHPIHVHLVDFHILSRSSNQQNSRGVLEYESLGLKDTVWLRPGENVTVEAIFAPWEGVYMFHCHNLVHEDHAMMAAFNVSLLEDFGYEENMHFIDPLDPAFAANDCDITDVVNRGGDFADERIAEALSSFETTGAYGDIDGVETALKAYWAGRAGATKKEKRNGPGGSAALRNSAKFRS